MPTIFDTDFQPDDSVLVYVGGRFTYEGTVEDMPEDLRTACDGYTWHLLAPVEGVKAVFIG